jgi:hypothetical protein
LLVKLRGLNMRATSSRSSPEATDFFFLFTIRIVQTNVEEMFLQGFGGVLFFQC